MKIEEHVEHAEHAHEHGNKQAALLIAVLAAVLAVCEQQAKRADIGTEENAVLAADTWNEYQAKSVRAAQAHSLELLAGTLDTPTDPAKLALRNEFIKQMRADQQHYEDDAKTGKGTLAANARHYEKTRQENLERAHTFDNASAALELGIVLSTASAITSAKLLLRFGFVMGAIGIVLALFGVVAPGLVVF
jgi:hypothetical protein